MESVHEMLFHKYLSQHKYLLEEFKYCRVLVANFNEKFKEDFQDYIERNLTDNQHVVIDRCNFQKDISEPDTSKNLLFKSIFLILVKKCHPDKETGSEEQFQDLNEAYEKHEIMNLFYIAERHHLLKHVFDIIYQTYYQDITSYMLADIQKLERDINDMKQTFAWKWAHRNSSDEEDMKAQIIRLIDTI